MVLRRASAGGGQRAPQRLVSAHAIEKCAGWIHAGAPCGEDSLGQNPQGLGVALEAAVLAQQMIEGALARMAEGRVAQIMRQTHRLDEVRIDEKPVIQRATGPRLEPIADGLANLRHFQRMGQPGPVKIVLAAPKHLGLVLHAPECRGVQHPVPVHLKRRPIIFARRRRRAPRHVKVPVKPVQHRRHPSLGPPRLATLSSRHPARRIHGARWSHCPSGADIQTPAGKGSHPGRLVGAV